MPPYKRQKLSAEPDIDSQAADSWDEAHSQISGDESGAADFSENESPDTSDEIASAKKQQKSRQTSKRKIRATGTSAFGATLQSLLNTDAPSTLPLSLKPSISRKRNDDKLELRAKKVLQIEKKEKEDKGRITDVIGGWGGESERALRKVAQRGVVKLFNAIQQSQATVSVAVEETKAARGSGKPTLPAPVINNKAKSKVKAKDKDNVIGRGKESAVDKDAFFDMIRSGGIVSKV